MHVLECYHKTTRALIAHLEKCTCALKVLTHHWQNIGHHFHKAITVKASFISIDICSLRVSHTHFCQYLLYFLVTTASSMVPCFQILRMCY